MDKMKAFLDAARAAEKSRSATLDYSNKDLENLPSDIGKCTKLKALILRDNKLRFLPPELGQLTNLTHLDVSNNQISYLPKGVCSLGGLESLQLKGNSFRTLPKQMKAMSGLKEISITLTDSSSHEERFAQLAQIPSLETLDLSDSHLGVIPHGLFDLTGLRALSLQRNGLRDIPPEITSLHSLERLDLSWNSLGSVPAAICELSSLRQLDLYANPLMSIPSTIANLHNLDSIALSSGRSDRFLESLPIEFIQLRNLRIVEVDGVQSPNASETILELICKLENLEKLSFINCRLERLPQQLARLRRLRELSITGNDISEFPGQLLSLKQIKRIDLDGQVIYDAASKSKEFFRFLTQRDVDLDNGCTLESLEYATALGMSVVNEDTEAAKRLLAAGANVDDSNNFGATPLYLAVLRENLELVRLLVNKGADIHIATKDGRNPLDSVQGTLADPMGYSGDKSVAARIQKILLAGRKRWWQFWR